MLRIIRSEKGQAAVELALVLPVLVLLLCGIMEFGRVYDASLVITQAAREGARAGAVGDTDAQVTSAVKTVAGSLNQNNLSITISPPQSSRTSGDNITVEINYSVQLVAPVISKLVPNPFPLSASTTMLVE
jgi:Flp pilus assembly protein TadG